MPRDNDGYDDRPKRSWAEIDKARSGGRSRSSSGATSGADRDRAKYEQSTSYSRYKTAADAFFSGETVPEGLAPTLDPKGESKAMKEALQKLRNIEDFRAFATAAKEHVDLHGVPDDPYLLDRMLGHPNDGIVLAALARITALLADGTFKAPKSLPERLKSLEIGSDTPEIQDGAKALGKTLRGK
jgi:hypothetical protein